MDANTALLEASRAAREIMLAVDALDDDDIFVAPPNAAYELAEAFQALDAWLTKGGYLPAAWREAKSAASS
jgi:hypothetical protein